MSSWSLSRFPEQKMISLLAKPIAVLIAFTGILVLVPSSGPTPTPPTVSQTLPLDLPLDGQSLPLTDQLMADQITEKISTTEWLGPLAPVAISPFFGITCLAGMSQFGKGTVLAQNNFISNNPVLNNPAVFWTFLVLTLLTSLPRLTKVSKPMAQALDQVETYAGIITLLVMKVLGSGGGGEIETAAVVQLGFMSFSSDILLSIAAVINIIVINTIKFFFEVLILITPIPFLDAIFEAGKQATCAGLLAIYAFSPIVATILNLIIFIACLWAYRWIHRRVLYARNVFFDPLLALWSSSYGRPTKPELVVFNKSQLGPFAAKSRLMLKKVDDGWSLRELKMFSFGLASQMHLADGANTIEMEKGMFVNHLNVTGDVTSDLLFTRRYSGQLEELSQLIKVKAPNGGPETVQLEFGAAHGI